ncbi:hypothetical protein BDR03DRAFT_985238 [Suillus americanus]|nr:hypothetical protein BDR03DRAFT_985238 [Suillus americanus]
MGMDEDPVDRDFDVDEDVHGTFNRSLRRTNYCNTTYSYNNELNKNICTLIHSSLPIVHSWMINSHIAHQSSTAMLIQVIAHCSQRFVSVSILNTHADQVVAHSSQREVSVSTLIQATAMLTLQVVAHRSQEEARMGVGKDAGASEVSNTSGFTRTDP